MTTQEKVPLYQRVTLTRHGRRDAIASMTQGPYTVQERIPLYVMTKWSELERNSYLNVIAKRLIKELEALQEARLAIQ